MTIGERIKARRKTLELTLEETGKLVGVSKQTIQRYETGEISNIPYDKIVLLSTALRCSPADFFFDENDQPKEGSANRIFTELFSKLSKEQQDSIIALMKSMLPSKAV